MLVDRYWRRTVWLRKSLNKERWTGGGAGVERRDPKGESRWDTREGVLEGPAADSPAILVVWEDFQGEKLIGEA